MAGTPRRYPAGGTPQQQEQGYMDQFNNAAYAPIPGVRGQQPLPPAPPPAIINGQPVYPGQSATNQWGRLLGQSPMWSELRSQYMNGALSNADWQTFLPGGAEGGPGQVAGQMQNHMARPAPAAMSGPYGRQAMQMAGLLGQPGQGYPAGGLLGGPKRGFRVPGGK